MIENVFREPPDDGDWDAETEEEASHALELQPNQMLVPGAVSLRTEGIETGGQALEGSKAGDGCRHVGH